MLDIDNQKIFDQMNQQIDRKVDIKEFKMKIECMADIHMVERVVDQILSHN